MLAEILPCSYHHKTMAGNAANKLVQSRKEAGKRAKKNGKAEAERLGHRKRVKMSTTIRMSEAAINQQRNIFRQKMVPH